MRKHATVWSYDEIETLIREGLTNTEICQRLRCSVNTINRCVRLRALHGLRDANKLSAGHPNARALLLAKAEQFEDDGPLGDDDGEQAPAPVEDDSWRAREVELLDHIAELSMEVTRLRRLLAGRAA